MTDVKLFWVRLVRSRLVSPETSLTPREALWWTAGQCEGNMSQGRNQLSIHRFREVDSHSMSAETPSLQGDRRASPASLRDLETTVVIPGPAAFPRCIYHP
ncbi:hypothetical protein CROQUDRAFT_93263 [Cronartium quercuum f. sp. fusiforme G11]|uniref:Uncharacterized protein n=1 Tax=Cronartium quercuum f. sp. fusiforme G11 TaxID=708437 RepID=A0A9P6NFI7_9BASI|nr:hypothetical protein CROQUDRAFT_93263 [Cronartium quercuum f. sp. fusiforme G11]